MKLLLYIPEFPFAHHGGAARSMRTIGEFMAKAGHQVHCLATTATERLCDTRDILANITPTKDHRTNSTYTHRGVFYRIVETEGSTRTWRTPSAENAVDEWFDHEIIEFGPDLVLAYGGYPSDEKRYARAKRSGAKLVIRLANFGYASHPFFNQFDGVLTCSRFLSDWYKTKIGIESTPLPLPIWPEDVIPHSHVPAYFTAINPARRKGSLLLLTIFRELHKQRPDIPLLVIGESNEPEFSEFAQYGVAIPWQTNQKQIYGQTKALLVPSVWEEPAGRVIAEAMLNGIPPIITDRGGMVEIANGGAYVLPLTKRITENWRQPVPLSVAQPWVDLIANIHDDKPIRAGVVERDAASIYHPEHTAPLYEAYFKAILGVGDTLTPAVHSVVGDGGSGIRARDFHNFSRTEQAIK
jgi:glycosyltransferase involved in cell wall biosynthesis